MGKLSQQDKIAIGREYLAKRKSRGGIGNNQHTKAIAGTGSTAYLLAQKYNVSEKSIKLWAKLAEQERFNKLAQQYFSSAKDASL